MNHVAGLAISAEICRVCEVVLTGSKVEESTTGESETVCAKALRPPRVC